GVPVFQRMHIESQLDSMFSPTVTLKSGGYIVINQTEALVSIDVNSGRATREHSIEETAHKTNLEAADEIGRQLRLRDLAGLIVIDFIDMEDGRNDRNVEKRIRDATKNDRARIQIGKISQFGLLEMSRQRLRAGVIAGSTVPCPHCAGQGIVRSVESTALRVLRALDEEGQKQRAASVNILVPSDVAIYTLNQKRREIARIENDYGMAVSFVPKDDILAGNLEIERTAVRALEDRKYFPSEAPPAPETFVEAPADLSEEIEEEQEHEDMTHAEPNSSASSGPRNGERSGERQGGERSAEGESGQRRGRRRRRGGRGRDRERGPMNASSPQPQQDQPALQQSSAPIVEDRFGFNDDIPDTTPVDGAPPQQSYRSDTPSTGDAPQGDGGPRRKRRRRRGRRREGGERFGTDAAGNQLEGVPVDGSVRDDGEEITGTADDGVEADIAVAPAEPAPNAPSAPVWSLTAEAPVKTEPKPPKATEPEAANDPSQPARKGWWQRTFKA
ncbi:MAG TPA: ribonuclease E/G, partial [Rhizomicrobium sp.]|nr:ribonuclease E/G [Rhizomicrobium sp.]